MSSQNYPKSLRLVTRREFTRVMKQGDRKVGKFLCIDCRPAKTLRLGITASNKYGTAPQRSRFKRLVREAFRINYSLLPCYELNIIPRSFAKKARYQDILHDILTLLTPK